MLRNVCWSRKHYQFTHIIYSTWIFQMFAGGICCSVKNTVINSFVRFVRVVNMFSKSIIHGERRRLDGQKTQVVFHKNLAGFHLVTTRDAVWQGKAVQWVVFLKRHFFLYMLTVFKILVCSHHRPPNMPHHLRALSHHFSFRSAEGAGASCVLYLLERHWKAVGCWTTTWVETCETHRKTMETHTKKQVGLERTERSQSTPCHCTFIRCTTTWN